MSDRLPLNFHKATLLYSQIALEWLAEPHVQEFWDNSPELKQDLLIFMKGRLEPSPYWNGIFDYWIGTFDDEPYCLLMTSEIVPDAADLPDLWKTHLSPSGRTFSIDFMIGSRAFLGKGLGALTLEAFTKFIQDTLDPSIDTFLIDPAASNPRAKHVYEKSGFRTVATFYRDHGEGKEVKHYLMVKHRPSKKWNQMKGDHPRMQEVPPQPLVEQVENASPNALTLNSYEQRIQEYIDGTTAEVRGNFKDWIDATVACLPPDAAILEIGSGFGRDANYLESFGFKVERTDATEAFVTFLQKQGHPARRFNVMTDPFSLQYDLIFANAVFLHFTPQELEAVLQKIHAALTDRGILAFSLKKGEGEEWSYAKLGEPRYFCYWELPKITALLQKQNFEIIQSSEDEQFLQIIAKPTQNKI